MVAAGVSLAIAATAIHWPGPIAHALDARIYIRWSPTVDDGARLDAERGLGLVAPRHVDARTWEYTPTRTTREAVERIVKDPRVEDTHNIDRAAFVIRGAPQEDPFAERLDHALEAAYDDQRMWVIAAVTLVLFCFVLPMFEQSGRWLAASIRPVAVGPFKVFRILFGLALAGAIWSTPFTGYSPRPLAEQRVESWFADWHVFHWLAADSTRLGPLQTIATVAAVVFAAGVASRVALAVAAAALALLVLGRLGVDSGHDWGLALTTTLALVVVPWDRIARESERSSDAMWRGFAIWLPGLMLGLGFFAAAMAKLLVSGPSWITTGAVRYHFVQDAEARISDITLWIASHPAAAVAVSAAAVAAEASLIFLALARGKFLRLAALALGIALLSGFHAFQGVLWYSWWMLLLSFLPWRGETGATASLPIAQGASRTVAIVVALQILSTAAVIEIEPFLSNFPMYSHTYDSPEAFNERYRADHESRREWVVDPSGCVRAGRDDALRKALEVTTTEFDFVAGAFVSKTSWFTMEPAGWVPTSPPTVCKAE